MDEKKIAFIICANDEMELQECQYYLSRLTVPEGMTTEMLSIWDAKSMASGYQEGMESTDAKYKVYLHQDTFIINPHFLYDIIGCFRENPQIGMIGSIGVSKWRMEEGYLPVNCYDTGKLFRNLNEKYLDYGIPKEGYEKVAMVDGLLMATQVDIPWREDLFQRWQLYDASQSMEMQRNGKEVVVPFQKTPWCYHDNTVNRMETYYGDYELFLKEYFPAADSSKLPKGETTLELKTKFSKLKKMMDMLLGSGDRKTFLNICKDPVVEKFPDFREYFLIANIEIEEMKNVTGYRLWEDGLSRDEIFARIRMLKHLIKRLEYDAEEGEECSYLQENYSMAAIEAIIEQYVWNRKKVADKIAVRKYEKLIRSMNPKPKFNLKWYRDEDLYSEGDIEDVVIKIIAENAPEDYVKAIAGNYCWSTFYHLTHIRKNIINWYPFDPEAEVLEIGCGMGAITNELCDKCKTVTAVELSKRRAIGALLRCREKGNLEIIVGNLNDIEFEKKFDIITLIGVLEYQGSYTDTDTPYVDFLRKVRSLLKPDGKLLIAIENQYGLKYWCGAREDHTGLPFDGLNQYEISDRKVRTFSKQALDELIKESGFRDTYFYYPMPDYKLPMVIYSQNCLPQNANMMNMQYYYVPNDHTLVAREEKIYEDLIQNQVFEFFANSFLVECSVKGNIGEVTFASLSCRRIPKYQVGTRFIGQKYAEKFALYEEKGAEHLRNIVTNESKLQERGLHVWSSVLKDKVLVSDYLKAQTMEDILLEAYHEKDIEKIYRVWDAVYADIERSSEEAPWEDNILYTIDLGIKPNKEKYGRILKIGYLDMIPRNVFWYQEQLYWIDQEWVLQNVPVGFVLFRALIAFHISFPESIQILPLLELAKKYNLVETWNDYQQLESLFNGAIIDYTYLSEEEGFQNKDENAVVDSIYRLLEKR